MTTMWQVDVHLYQFLNQEVQRHKSYRGTSEALPGDEQRIRALCEKLDRHFFVMCLDRLDRAHLELEKGKQ